MLVVSSEGIFHTVQGEGKLVGYPSIFVRLSQCNLRCKWKNEDGSFTSCDTPHTSFEPEMNNKVSVDELVAQISAIDCKHVVVTGGEPFFQKEVVELINRLHDLGRHVTVETNGTIFRPSKADLLSISVKLSSSSQDEVHGKRHESNRLNLKSLVQFVKSGADIQFKFVVNDELDIAEILGLSADIEAEISADIGPSIWLMPQGVSSQQLDSKMLWVVGLCKKYGWKMTDRLHIRIWGHQKGV